MDLQTFHPVKNFADRYFVSHSGEVYSTKTKRLLTPCVTEKGYLTVELWKNYNRKVVKIHRLVAETFIPNPEDKPEVNHKDGNKQNNHVSNLEWCTRSENLKHAYETGLRVSGQKIKTSDR